MDSPDGSAGGLTRTEHRGLRELYASARHLVSHWESLEPKLTGDPAAPILRQGVLAARDLLLEEAELTEAYGLFGFPAAQSVGAQMAGARNLVGDRFLERNQALRFAVLDVAHLTTLLAYLGVVAEGRSDERLSGFCIRWERRLRRIEREIRAAAVAAGERPESAVEPLDHSVAGHAAHAMAHAVGTVGEWFDRRIGAGRGTPGGPPDAVG